MDEKYIQELLGRYEKRECTPEEATLVESLHLRKFMYPGNSAKDEVKCEVWAAVNSTIISSKAVGKPKAFISFKYAAAVFLTIAGMGYYYFTASRHSKTSIEQVTVIDDVTPGGNLAFLTLSDGSHITLDSTSKGTLAWQAGIIVSKTDYGEVVYKASSSYPPNNPENPIFNSITTPKGGQFQVVLPDGSKVWLNAASSIKFPISFTGQERRTVTLTGEAYFEIAKNKKQPFTVSTATQTVEVLGTRFNVNSYPDESAVKTTLLEGSVRIFSTSLNLSKTLIPGQTAYHQNERILIQPADETAVAWKNGLIKIQNAGLPALMRQVSRWYNLEVKYEGAIPTKHFTAGISRDSNLSELLRILEGMGIRFRIEHSASGNVLIVKY